MIETRELSQKFGGCFWYSAKTEMSRMNPRASCVIGQAPSTPFMPQTSRLYTVVTNTIWSRLHYFNLEYRRDFTSLATITSTPKRGACRLSSYQHGRQGQLHHGPPSRHSRTRIPISRREELPRPLQHVQSLPAAVDQIRSRVLELSRPNDFPRTEPTSRTT